MSISRDFSSLASQGVDAAEFAKLDGVTVTTAQINAPTTLGAVTAGSLGSNVTGGAGLDAPAIKVAIVYETQASGTNSASNPATSGSWKTLTLNASHDPSSILTSVTSNVITLAAAGTYLFYWTSMGIADIGFFQSRIVDITGPTYGYSTPEWEWSGGAIGHHASGSWIHVAAAVSNTYRIEQNGTSTYQYGMGRAVSKGPEIYTRITITKLS
jgi:hypothetical protein